MTATRPESMALCREDRWHGRRASGDVADRSRRWYGAESPAVVASREALDLHQFGPRVAEPIVQYGTAGSRARSMVPTLSRGCTLVSLSVGAAACCPPLPETFSGFCAIARLTGGGTLEHTYGAIADGIRGPGAPASSWPSRGTARSPSMTGPMSPSGRLLSTWAGLGWRTPGPRLGVRGRSASSLVYRAGLDLRHGGPHRWSRPRQYPRSRLILGVTATRA